MDPTLPKPSRIGAYDIIDVIGRGGMGTVFRGNDPVIGRPVAIKMLTAAAADPDLLNRFYREAKYTGSLHHQNIVTVYELGHQDGVPFLVMEYLEGASLDALMGSGRPMPIAEKIGIILQVCSGLTYAHQRGLVHRDIKPANIVILDDGTAKIVDFGIALLGSNHLTRTGLIVGSLNYMSPEQLNGDVDVDVRTDVYSTGVVLFQLLTGVLPFEGATTAATLRKIVQEPPPPLAKYLADCPPELEAVVQKALAKNRDERYPAPEDFSLELARVHQPYLKKLLAETLMQASDSLRRKDYIAARQQVLQVLRSAPHDMEGVELLRKITRGQEQLQREQQILQLQMKAEESFRKNHLDEAMQFVDQGLQLDPEGAVFLGLREAIAEAQARVARYRETLKRAETALTSGDLETAKLSVEEAQRILPGDPAARATAAKIIARLEEQLHEQKMTDQQRQFLRTTNSVEKALADARMLLSMGQVPQAVETLAEIENVVAQMPPQWGQQFVALRKEALDQAEGRKPSAAKSWTDRLDGQTIEIPAPRDAKVTMQPPVPAPAVRNDLPTLPAPPLQSRGLPPVQMPHDVLHPRAEEPRERGEVAPELREFLQPERSKWPRSIWVVVAVIVLAGVLAWLKVQPANESKLPQKPAAVASYTYAEINAEPWATVTAVTPLSGDAQQIIGQQTPLRVKLPPGEYNVTMQGPNHQEKRIDITVPQQGGVACFAVFSKPDLNRMVGP
jgi:serine/threonine protein kinase